MISTQKKKNQLKKQLSQLNVTLNDFVIGSCSNASAMENETLQQQTNGHFNDFERTVDSASHNEVIGNNIDD